jgi:hypothetical protein
VVAVLAEFRRKAEETRELHASNPGAGEGKLPGELPALFRFRYFSLRFDGLGCSAVHHAPRLPAGRIAAVQWPRARTASRGGKLHGLRLAVRGSSRAPVALTPAPPAPVPRGPRNQRLRPAMRASDSSGPHNGTHCGSANRAFKAPRSRQAALRRLCGSAGGAPTGAPGSGRHRTLGDLESKECLPIGLRPRPSGLCADRAGMPLPRTGGPALRSALIHADHGPPFDAASGQQTGLFRPLTFSGLTSCSAMCTATINHSRHTT